MGDQSRLMPSPFKPWNFSRFPECLMILCTVEGGKKTKKTKSEKCQSSPSLLLKE